LKQKENLMIQILANKKILNKNTSSYPLLLSDIKAKSEYFTLNPTDTSQDNYIQNLLIPNVIKNWEEATGYYLLDQTLVNFLYFKENYINEVITGLDYISLNSLNVRNINSVKYYNWNWDKESPKITLENTKYYFTDELLRNPKKFRLKCENDIITLYRIENNFQIEFTAGFLNNNFSSLNQEIKDCLVMQTATIIDKKNKLCNNLYNDLISNTYFNFGIEKPFLYFI